MNCLIGQRKDVLGSAKGYDHTITETVKWMVRQVFNEKYSDCILYYFGFSLVGFILRYYLSLSAQELGCSKNLSEDTLFA